MAEKKALGPLKTKHDVVIEIDDLSFNITVRSVNKLIQEKLDKTRKDGASRYEAVDSKRIRLKEINELKDINDLILKSDDTQGKSKIYLEQKQYISEAFKLEKEIKDLEKDLTSVNEMLEDYYKQMFEECISGTNKVALENCIKDNGISYSVLYIYINEAVKVAIEKK
jgi:hypothetical protein